VNNGLLQLISERAVDEGRRRIHGVVIGIVTNNTDDPDGLGRVKVRFPWLSDRDDSFWARVATLMAGPDRGLYFLPEVDDEVLVLFEHGDVRFPYVIGSLWNGKDKAPADNGNGKNDVRVIKSRSGHVIKLNDAEGNETVEIVAAGGKNRVVIDTASNTITVTSGKDIVLEARQGTITLDAKSIDIKSSTNAHIKASGSMTAEAGGAMAVRGAIVNIN
jgi:uncharacterized protein involved in type VI secretion and phage assembly